MANNAAAFEEYLGTQNIGMEKGTHEENTVFFIRENLEAVGPVSLMLLFNDSDRYVTLISFKYLPFPAQKRGAMLELINTLNAEYTLVKFVDSGEAVSVQVVVPFHDNFVPEVIVEMASLILQAMQEEHPRFQEAMK